VKWGEVNCSDVRWNGTVGNLDGVKPNEKVVKCSWVKFKWEEVKCRQVYWSVVKILVTGCLTLLVDIYISYEVCCLYGFFVYHILSCSFGSIF